MIMASKSHNPTAENDQENQPSTPWRRIERLSLHVNPTPNHHNLSQQMEMMICAGRAKNIEVKVEQLSSFMRGKHRDIQERVFEYFKSRPELQTPVEISKDEHRELCMRQLVGLVREANVRPFKYVGDDPAKYFAIAEAVGSVDMSLGIKMGVQYR